MRLQEGASAHGRGLFAGTDLADGQRLGRWWGAVLDVDCDEARRLRSDRLILLRVARETRVVDVTGCVFEWLNHAASDSELCNVSVSPAGVVTTVREVGRGEELRWDYNDPSFWAVAPE